MTNHYAALCAMCIGFRSLPVLAINNISNGSEPPMTKLVSLLPNLAFTASLRQYACIKRRSKTLLHYRMAAFNNKVHYSSVWMAFICENKTPFVCSLFTFNSHVLCYHAAIQYPFICHFLCSFIHQIHGYWINTSFTDAAATTQLISSCILPFVFIISQIPFRRINYSMIRSGSLQ